jgi:hypothetical protein
MKTRATGAAILALTLALGGTLLGAAGASADEAERKQPKVTICHLTASASNPSETIDVAEASLPAHVAHGDTLGECAPEPEPEPTPDPSPTPEPTPTETPEPAVEQHEASECASTTEYTTTTWTTTDGVISDEVSDSRQLDRADAITLGCYTPPIIDCAEWTVPGWLNEHGDATSCVSNNPCPEVEPGETCPGDEVPTDEPTEPTDEPTEPEVPVEVPTDTAEPVVPAVEPVEAINVVPAAAATKLPATLAYTGEKSEGPSILALGAFALMLGLALVVVAALPAKQGA